jgi:hypothetical protein
MNHIIESIGKWGVVSTPTNIRLSRVQGGDIIEVPEEFRRYPTTHQYSRIANVKDGIAHICENMGSAYLHEDGSCDISGGPFWSMPVDLLKPTLTTRQADYWNFANGVGAGMGIHYTIARPVHQITIHPDDLQYRYGVTEEIARKGMWSNDLLETNDWIIHSKLEDTRDGFRWIFRKKHFATIVG